MSPIGYSSLAWELAQHARLDNPAGTISAGIFVKIHEGASGKIGMWIEGFGVTADEAKRALARNLDRWGAKEDFEQVSPSQQGDGDPRSDG